MKLRVIGYWKKELATMHPTEYIALLQAIREHNIESRKNVWMGA